MEAYSTKLNKFSKDLDNICKAGRKATNKDDQQGTDRAKTAFLSTLEHVCSLIREADAATSSLTVNADDWTRFIEKTDDLLVKAVKGGLSSELFYDAIPSFAHSADAGFPLLEDTSVGNKLSGVLAGTLESFMSVFLPMLGSRPAPKKALDMLKPPARWPSSPHPSPETTPLSRFVEDLGLFSATSLTPDAINICQARCEVRSREITGGMQLNLSADGQCMVIPSRGGWKSRVPYLRYYIRRNDEWHSKSVKLPLTGLASHTAVSTADAGGLIFVADDERIKSYNWDTKLPVHTFDSDEYTGPLSLLSSTRVMRAGKGSVAVWDLSSPDIATHGPTGKDRIGEGTFDKSNTWRDEDDYIELSTGSGPTTTIDWMGYPNWEVDRWHPFPGRDGVMLTASRSDDSSDEMSGDDDNAYSCLAFDLGHGGHVVQRFLGHGGEVTGFSTCLEDLNLFTTSCADGSARLFDVRDRRSLPVITASVGQPGEACAVSSLVVGNGLPFIFAAPAGSQVIKVFDIRAQSMLYELSTGNNNVVEEGLVWNPHLNSLYALTNCPFDPISHDGSSSYRPAIVYKKKNAATIPPSDEETSSSSPAVSGTKATARSEYERIVRLAQSTQGIDDADDDGDENYVDEDDEDMEDDEEGPEEDEYEATPHPDIRWPKRARHDENFFGVMWDARGDALLEYTFTASPNPDVIPATDSFFGHFDDATFDT